jgi:integrase
MESAMKMPFRLYRRGKTYYAQNNDTGEQESLRTKDNATATRLLNAKNESTMLMGSNLLVARAYMVASDPEMPKRTWKNVIDFIIAEKPDTARHRWISVTKDKALTPLWRLRVVETRAEQFLVMLKRGTVSTNTYLRRLHNYALDMNWLPWPILPKKRWPKIVYGEKRGITLEEHRRIIEAEAEAARRNQGSRTGDQPHYNERRDYYELLWFTGGSQSDIAALHAEDIDLKDQTIHYRRKKSGRDAMPRFGKGAATILARRPKTGPLFPYLITCDCKDRATEFKQRCDGLGIKGISLHSYRYGWAERAAEAGYPERHAQSHLGHGSKAVARAYAKKAKVKTPPLEDYEEAQRQADGKIVPFPRDVDVEGQRVTNSLQVSTPSLS